MRGDITSRTYREFNANKLKEKSMGFGIGQAVKEMRDGQKVRREGWNGKGMFLYYVPANSYPAQTDIAKDYWKDRQPPAVENTQTPIMVPYSAYIALKSAKENVIPWNASQDDLLAVDWQIAD